jgi:hypothetical protein
VTIIRVPYNNTNNIKMIAQNVSLKPSDGTVSILSARCDRKISNYVIVKTHKIGCVYIVS